MKPAVKLLFVALVELILPPAFGLPVSSNAVVQATNSLATFKTLITPANYFLMGFHTLAESALATNAEPVPIYSVRQDQLMNFHPGQDFATLLEVNPHQEPAPRAIVPIMVGTNVRSSAILRFAPQPGAPDLWTNSDWCQPKLIRDLMETYHAIPGTQIRAGSIPFAVEIPVFKLWFVGYYNPQNKLIVRSTVDLPLGTNAIARTQIVTDGAMQKLATTAQRYNGLPN